MGLRIIIMGALGAMILAHGWMVGGDLIDLWRKSTAAEALVHEVGTVRNLVDAAQAVAYERGLTASVVKGLDPEESGLAARREATDAALDAALAALPPNDPAGVLLNTGIARLADLRGRVDTALTKGGPAPDAAREPWLRGVSGFVTTLEQAVFDRPLPPGSESLALFEDWQIMVQALRLRVAMGQDGAALNAVVYDRRLMMPDEIVFHERLLGRVREVYDGLRRDAGDQPSLRKTLDVIAETYWDTFVPLRNAVLEDARAGRVSDVSGATFVETVVPAVNAMVDLIHAAIDAVEAKASRQVGTMRHDLWSGAALSLGYLLLAGVILAIVQWRVVRPVTEMIDRLDAELESAPTPRESAPGGDEIGRLKQAVAGFLSGREALRASEQRFKMAVEAAADGIWDWDLVSGQIWFSPQWKAQLGYADHEIENTLESWQRLIFPEDAATAMQMVKEYNTGQRESFEAVQRFRHKDGHAVLIHSRAVHETNAAGEAIRMVGAHTDITERTQALNALADKERELSSILESVADGIITLNADGTIRTTNPAAERIFGVEAAALIGQPFDSLLADDGPQTAGLRLDMLASGDGDGGAALICTGRRRDGEMFPLALNFAAVEIAGERAFTGVLRDDTERVRYEKTLEQSRAVMQERAEQLSALAEKLETARAEAEQADRAKTRFLTVMSHELRTPMTGILGTADLLLTTPLDAQQRTWMLMLKRSGETLLMLLNDVLDFSKIEAGELVLETLDFDPVTVMRDVLDLLEGSASRKAVVLETELAAPPPPAVRGDPTRLRQVLLNLVGNAVKFTERGRIVVRLAAVDHLDSNDIRLRFEVADTGIGISPDQMARLFQPFSQADADTTRRFGGTGLGLAISRSLTEAMRGEIGCTSTPGVGSTFWFTIRVTEGAVDRLPRPAEDRGAMPTAADGPGRRILIAEDNATNRMLLCDALSLRGHQVVAVQNGAEALEAVRGAPFDIVLMDLQMPVMDGIQAARAMRADDGPAHRVPIVALTADALADQTLAGDAAAFNAVLTKPVDWCRLDATIVSMTRQGAVAPDTSVADPASARTEKTGWSPGNAPAFQSDWIQGMGMTLPPDRLSAILDSLLAQIGQPVEALNAAIDAADATAIGLALHSLAGLSEQFGLQRLASLSRYLETLAQKGDLNALSAMRPDLTRELAAARAAVTSYRARSEA